MNHSIIIPHYGRKDYLWRCIYSIVHSDFGWAVNSYEIVVVEYAPGPSRYKGTGRNSLTIWPAEKPFNKSRLLNYGIGKTDSELVTVLDCDMLVGPRWLRCSDLLFQDPALTRVAYRVRHLTLHDRARVFEDGAAVGEMFAQYNAPGAFGPGGNEAGRFGLGWEAYGDPEINTGLGGGAALAQPWGNSQFTMRRRDIEGLSFDERQAGKGWEDVDFNRQVAAKFGDQFQGTIATEGSHGLLHMQHERPDDWDSGEIRERNLAKYRERWGK